ncbi:hypothetical protein CENSYa_0810 [Cenarchaeum symbiosum A]|uniref:Uncharacterized protein n=1 Tax=Cenarchaeum symbiosum (strain A) TaxID=414004 RepID=A0RVS6_CENSY|nr:hypothetical protein CENSYa_0810 [Cenarchaeum symbiosum A]
MPAVDQSRIPGTGSTWAAFFRVCNLHVAAYTTYLACGSRGWSPVSRPVYGGASSTCPKYECTLRPATCPYKSSGCGCKICVPKLKSAGAAGVPCALLYSKIWGKTGPGHCVDNCKTDVLSVFTLS